MTGTRDPHVTPPAHFKDAVLDHLADTANVAQFVSFGPGPEPLLRYARIHGHQADHTFHAVKTAVEALLEASVERSVNVRSFDPNQPKAHDFLYGLQEASEAVAAVVRLAARGLHTIVNETIDVNDGGVSGVSHSGLLEFAPEDTPRCVEKPGTALFSRDLGLAVLETVYGFRPALDYDEDLRVEFSIHPLKRGFRHEHTIIWEMERAEAPPRPAVEVIWPNRFSRFIGDKVFGLLVADANGLPVPASTVIAREVAPFRFGRVTGSGEYWIRTSPLEQVPGHFTTKFGWLDPFSLMATEDVEGRRISSVLAQEGVDAVFSGASAIEANGDIVVEAVAGTGEDFMQGSVPPQDDLPSRIVGDVKAIHKATERLGSVSFEWVHDGVTAWVVQLNLGATSTAGLVLYPGEPVSEHRFRVEEGLKALRMLVERVEGTGDGIVLVGRVGVTSHFGQVLRGGRIPSRMEAAETSDDP
jgi:hypothetical protein